MTPVPSERHLLRAKDLADARYHEPLDVDTLARAAFVSPAHFSRQFRRALLVSSPDGFSQQERDYESAGFVLQPVFQSSAAVVAQLAPM